MKNLKFIDLFSGIGGFHLALHELGAECVFASEIDEPARITYQHNFKKISPQLFENNLFNNDIRAISPKEIPDFDILCAGFPCQPFSQAGHKRGFNDNHKSERGNLFFNLVDIIEAKKPQAFFLENVRGIVNHDNGNTFKVIREILEDELGYSFYYQIVKASDYGLPQLRPRAFMIGFRDEEGLKSFNFPQQKPLKFNMSDVWGGECSREIGFTLRVGGRGSKIDDRRNWDAYLVDGEVKKLMPEQGKKMQGFPEDFVFPVSPTQAMKQLGNSVAVDAVRECAKAMLDHIHTLNMRNNPMKHTDIVLDIENNELKKANEGFGIKSYLGSKPTLLNASGNTNFIFSIDHLSCEHIDAINSIDTRTKLKDRLERIHSLGGGLRFYKIETDTMSYNLSMVDSIMPELIAKMLLEFFINRQSKVKNNLESLYNSGGLSEFSGNDLISFQVKIKRLLVAVLLGFFAGSKWDGKYISNGTIVVKEDGEQVGFHLVDKSALEDYLFENIKFDTPSTTRHRYGSLISEHDGKLYFKLNLQLRF